MRFLSVLPVFVTLSCFSTAANSQTITFESLPTLGAGSGCVGIPGGTVTDSGFTFGTGSLRACDATGGFGISSNDSKSLGLQNQTLLTIQRLDSTPFTFSSFDATGLFINQSTNSSANATGIAVTGTFPGGATVQSNFTFDSIGDGAGGQLDFETFSLPGTFTDIESVTLQGTGPNDNDFAFDNFSISAVPEPGATTAVACAFCVLLARRNRSKRSIR